MSAFEPRAVHTPSIAYHLRHIRGEFSYGDLFSCRLSENEPRYDSQDNADDTDGLQRAVPRGICLVKSSGYLAADGLSDIYANVEDAATKTSVRVRNEGGGGPYLLASKHTSHKQKSSSMEPGH